LSGDQRKLAAIMLTDMVGYTALAQASEAQALSRLEEHRAILRPAFLRHNGNEVKTMGDAFLVEFPSALEAVQCSIDIQNQMHDRNARAPASEQIQLRIGVHVGDVVHRGGDILGDAVNVSSRIEPLAQAGGVCISEQAYDHVRNKLDLPLEKIEQKNLKNVSLPIDVYRIVMPWELEDKKAEEGAPESDPRRLAVLPMKNMSPDPNDEYFADGMTEELITTLSAVTGLTVIARTSVMQYKNAPKRIAEIGRELNVGTLIEGSVRKSGDKVRITTQLIRAKDEGHLWAQSYDKKLDDIFTVQSEVAQKVAEALKIRFAEEEKRRIERGATRNAEAYTLYLKGMFHWNKRTLLAEKKAVGFFEEAVRVDPTFALGYAGLAHCYQVMAANYEDDPMTCYPKAKEYALKALSLDSDLAEAHTVLAAELVAYERDLTRSEEEFKRAIELDPNYPTAHQWYSQVLGFQRRQSEALREISKALELSPLSLIINTNMVDGCYYAKQFDRGIELSKKVIDMDPTFAFIYPSLILIYLAKSMHVEALQAAETYSKLAEPADAKLVYANVYAHAGNFYESRRLLSELEGEHKEHHISPYSIALVRFQLGDNDKGFELLERAYRDHDRYLFAMAIDPELDGVRSDPRYLSMLERIGLAKHIRDQSE
jgi:adenylate cyclase